MKKNILKLLILVFLLIPLKILAAGDITVSPTSITIEEGSSKTITITANNAIGDVSIKSSNSKIAKVSTGEWKTGMVEANEKKTGKITIKGVSVGKTTIVFTLDAATFDGNDLSGKTRIVDVVVTKKTSKPSTGKTDNIKSTNNKLEEISVSGYKLTKVNDNNYTLNVNNSVKNITISARAEDSKAKVSGTGNYNLKTGENKIEIVITSESGNKNKIIVKVNRGEKTFKDILIDSEVNNIDISLLNYGLITKEYLDIIKDNKRIISFDYKDESGKLLYSWIINGNEIKEYNEFITTVKFNSEYEYEIVKLNNRTSGKYVSFVHDDVLPKGTKIKLYVGNIIKDSDKAFVYSYNPNDNKLELKDEFIPVENGYVTIDIKKCNDLFITNKKIGTIEKTVSFLEEYKYIIGGGVIFVILILLIKSLSKKK